MFDNSTIEAFVRGEQRGSDANFDPTRACDAVAEELAKSREMMRRVAGGDLLIGSMPPRPPTLRGWVGAVLVHIMRRPLAWLTLQMREFQLAAAKQIDAQADALEKYNRLNIMERLPELERSMDGVRQEFSRLRRTEERLERLSDVTSVHDSRLDAFRFIVPELREHLNENKQGIEIAQRELARIRQEIRQMAALQAEVSSLREQSQKTGGWQEALAEIRKDVQIANLAFSEIAEIRAKSEQASQAVNALEASLREFAAFRQDMRALEGLPSMVRDADRRGHHLQRELAVQERRLSIALEEVRKRNMHVVGEAFPDSGAEEFLDPMYVHFE